MKKLLTLALFLGTMLFSACGPDNHMDNPDGNDPNDGGNNNKQPSLTFSFLMNANDPNQFVLGPHHRKVGLIQGKDFVTTNVEGDQILKCLIGTEVDPNTPVKFFSVASGYSQEFGNVYVGDEPGQNSATFWMNITCPKRDSLIISNGNPVKVTLDQTKGVFIFPPFAQAEMVVVDLVGSTHTPHVFRTYERYADLDSLRLGMTDWKVRLITPYANKEIAYEQGN